MAYENLNLPYTTKTVCPNQDLIFDHKGNLVGLTWFKGHPQLDPLFECWYFGKKIGIETDQRSAAYRLMLYAYGGS